MYIYIHTYIYAYIYIYMHIYIYAYIYEYIYINAYIYFTAVMLYQFLQYLSKYALLSTSCFTTRNEQRSLDIERLLTTQENFYI